MALPDISLPVLAAGGCLVAAVLLVAGLVLSDIAPVAPPVPQAVAPPQPVALPERPETFLYRCADAQGKHWLQSYPCVHAGAVEEALATKRQETLQRACQAATTIRWTDGVTRKAYDWIPQGGSYGGQMWTLDDLTCLFGQPGEEVSAAGQYYTYRWHAPHGGRLAITVLKIGETIYEIVAKAQVGLP